MSTDSVAETQSGIPVPLYKILKDGTSCHGGDMEWSLPTLNDDGSYTPGEWMTLAADRPLVLCKYALHLTDQPAAWYQPDTQCWLAEYRGETVGELDGGWESKIGVCEARLVGYVTHELRLDPRHQHDSHAERRQTALKSRYGRDGGGGAVTAFVYVWLVAWIAAAVLLLLGSGAVWADAWPWLGLSALFGLLGVAGE